ncbi:hypothetical protein LJC63_08335, partial [Ruminococcaceae bacterium OttesenSCG-928-L11]|nr:hypothetical protein [Ruminococcaceae bacterium OttesenSCG-928-L11]
SWLVHASMPCALLLAPFVRPLAPPPGKAGDFARWLLARPNRAARRELRFRIRETPPPVGVVAGLPSAGNSRLIFQPIYPLQSAKRHVSSFKLAERLVCSFKLLSC